MRELRAAAWKYFVRVSMLPNLGREGWVYLILSLAGIAMMAFIGLSHFRSMHLGTLVLICVIEFLAILWMFKAREVANRNTVARISSELGTGFNDDNLYRAKKALLESLLRPFGSLLPVALEKAVWIRGVYESNVLPAPDEFPVFLGSLVYERESRSRIISLFIAVFAFMGGLLVAHAHGADAVLDDIFYLVSSLPWGILMFMFVMTLLGAAMPLYMLWTGVVVPLLMLSGDTSKQIRFLMAEAAFFCYLQDSSILLMRPSLGAKFRTWLARHFGTGVGSRKSSEAS